MLQSPLGPERVGVDMHIASIRPAAHDDGTAPGTFHRRIVPGRFDAAHDSFGPGAHAHFPANHERDAAEHFLLLHVWNVGERDPYPLHELLVSPVLCPGFQFSVRSTIADGWFKGTHGWQDKDLKPDPFSACDPFSAWTPFQRDPFSAVLPL